MLLIGSSVIYVETQREYMCNVTKVEVGVVEVVVYFKIKNTSEERLLIKVFKNNSPDKRKWISQFQIGDLKKCWIDKKDGVYLDKKNPPGAFTVILVAALVGFFCLCLPLTIILINSCND
jgi:hypothetical protein